MEVGRVHLLATDGESFDPMVMRPDRQYMGDQGIVTGKVVGVAVALLLGRPPDDVQLLTYTQFSAPS